MKKPKREKRKTIERKWRTTVWVPIGADNWKRTTTVTMTTTTRLRTKTNLKRRRRMNSKPQHQIHQKKPPRKKEGKWIGEREARERSERWEKKK
jgi:hypothetical protein